MDFAISARARMVLPVIQRAASARERPPPGLCRPAGRHV